LLSASRAASRDGVGACTSVLDDPVYSVLVLILAFFSAGALFVLTGG
jgi:NADH:ubiquinone oxidoreductase subunit 6 (subunit J)